MNATHNLPLSGGGINGEAASSRDLAGELTRLWACGPSPAGAMSGFAKVRNAPRFERLPASPA